jgi:hypothetical protein
VRKEKRNSADVQRNRQMCGEVMLPDLYSFR